MMDENQISDTNGDAEESTRVPFFGDRKPFEKVVLFTPMLFLLIIFAIIGVDAFSTKSTPLLQQLSDTATARGLITLLISVGAVWVAIILAVGAFSKADDKQFTRAKDVLVIMIGLLGTIVGYYFGSESSNNPQAVDQNYTETSAPADSSSGMEEK
jgi:hypothetical protein